MKRRAIRSSGKKRKRTGRKTKMLAEVKATESGALRLNLLVQPGFRDLLIDLEARTSAHSVCEVVRRSVALYDAVWRLQKRGGAFFCRDRKNKVTEFIVI